MSSYAVLGAIVSLAATSSAVSSASAITTPTPAIGSYHGEPARLIARYVARFADRRATSVLVHDHAREHGAEVDKESPPKPHRDDLARRVLEALDLIQVAMIERFTDRLPRDVEALEVADPPEHRIDGADEFHVNRVRVPVQARALVRGWDHW